jgi:hypothetical protein
MTLKNIKKTISWLLLITILIFAFFYKIGFIFWAALTSGFIIEIFNLYILFIMLGGNTLKEKNVLASYFVKTFFLKIPFALLMFYIFGFVLKLNIIAIVLGFGLAFIFKFLYFLAYIKNAPNEKSGENNGIHNF